MDKIVCKNCGSVEIKKNGFVFGVQRYQCKKCGHTHFPKSETEVDTSMHIGWSRYIKCPNCNKRSWHKKVLTKDKEQ
jgi:transposase-like protein